MAGTVIPDYYVCSDKVCDRIPDCDEYDDEKNCGVMDGTEYDETSLNRSSASCNLHDDILLLQSYNGCLEKNERVEKNKNNCCDTLISSQSNCTEKDDIGVVCEVNGYSTSISKYMICSSLSKKCRTCDDGIEKNCFQSLTCNVHKHLLCNGNHDCYDGSDETNSICQYKTRETCERRVGQSWGPIPLAWLNDGVEDCTDGSDENDLQKWHSCGWDRTGGGQWRKMANNGEKWRIMAMANSAFSFVKFAIFRQFLILEFHI